MDRVYSNGIHEKCSFSILLPRLFISRANFNNTITYNIILFEIDISCEVLTNIFELSFYETCNTLYHIESKDYSKIQTHLFFSISLKA